MTIDNLKCTLGIHNWRSSATFSNAVPLYVRQELKTDMLVCTRCCKVKKINITMRSKYGKS